MKSNRNVTVGQFVGTDEATQSTGGHQRYGERRRIGGGGRRNGDAQTPRVGTERCRVGQTHARLRFRFAVGPIVSQCQRSLRPEWCRPLPLPPRVSSVLLLRRVSLPRRLQFCHFLSSLTILKAILTKCQDGVATVRLLRAFSRRHRRLCRRHPCRFHRSHCLRFVRLRLFVVLSLLNISNSVKNIFLCFCPL